MPRKDFDTDVRLTTFAERLGNLVACGPLFDQRLTELLESLGVLDRKSKGHPVSRIFCGGEELGRLRLDKLCEAMHQPFLHLRNEDLRNKRR